ncbi:MAG: hypothetical protein Q9163_002314 [Psora crenata]
MFGSVVKYNGQKFIRGVEVDDCQPRDIKPVAYEEDFPFPYNNFVYAVNISLEGPVAHNRARRQPGTHEIPPGLDLFILRLPNPTSGYNNKIRVENEVAALSIARDALQAKFPGFIPRVFGWGSAKYDQGWILQEHMAGCPLLDHFGQMSDEDKAFMLGQMAEVLTILQQYQLPATIRGYGGLDFGPSGECISGPLSILDAGPFTTYEGLVKAAIQSKLAKADTDPQVEGWRANGVRARLDAFIAEGLHVAMENMGTFPKVLVHADFTPDNFLYDMGTMRLSALLDFDFSHIATFADEFLRSLGAEIGQFPSPRESGELLALRTAMLTGFPDQLPPSSNDVHWPSAKAWDDALRERGAKRPRTIENIAALSDLFWLSGQILPFKLCNEVVVRNSSQEQLATRKKTGEGLLNSFLSDYGF